MRVLIVVLLASLGVHSNDAIPRETLRNVSAQVYSTVTSPAGLPKCVRAALIKHLAGPMEMAPADGRFNHGCLLEPGLPRHRLIVAATNARYSIVHFEEGGFAPIRRVVVFSHLAGSDQATVVWSGTMISDFGTHASFLEALRSGKLWSEASLALPVVR